MFALQNLPVVFCLDRSGLVGQDGATHHGVFDLAYLRCIPNLHIFAPRNEIELRNIMYTVQLSIEKPIAIRYPRGKGKLEKWKLPFKKINIGENICLEEGNDLAVLSNGTIAYNVSQALKKVKNKHSIAHYDIRFVKPIDKKLLLEIFNKFNKIVTIEDGTIKGGFGSAVLEYASEKNYCGDIKLLGVPDEFIHHGTIDELQKQCGIDIDSIQNNIEDLLK